MDVATQDRSPRKKNCQVYKLLFISPVGYAHPPSLPPLYNYTQSFYDLRFSSNVALLFYFIMSKDQY